LKRRPPWRPRSAFQRPRSGGSAGRSAIASLKDLKSSLQVDLGEKAWLIGDRLKDFHRRSQQGNAELAHALEREIAALVTVYELAATAPFAAAVHRLARRRAVWVAGFQTERGHAAELAHNLQYLRAGVQLADTSGGHFAEILLSPPRTPRWC
jgi:DNA-binding MurR/RpiR family transcriptional regulator